MQEYRAAVLGKPIAHSLSPTIHNAGFAAAGLVRWSYTAIECAESELADRVAGLGPEWAGLSLTMPLKATALTVADDVSPLAAAIGAANTLVRRADGSWFAENTDAPGIVDALATAGLTAAPRLCVIGAGGTARAALAAARELGAAEAVVLARRPAAVAALASVAGYAGLRLRHVPWHTPAEALAGADVVISTVPAGVADPLAPLVAKVPPPVYLDALYDPWPTPVAAAALAAGSRVVAGIELLLAQAFRQFVMFTGVAAPVAAMRAALAAPRGA